MSVDSNEKKWSLVSYNLPFNSPIPESTDGLGVGDKQHLLWGYSGIAWGSVHYPREMYDYLSGTTLTPDYTGTTLQLFSQVIATESSEDSMMVIRRADDGSEERISFDDDPIFYVTLGWNKLDESDAGTLFDFYNDPNKGNKTQKSFYFLHKGELTDQHTYIARFASPMSRTLEDQNYFGFKSVKLRILGLPG